MHDFAAVQIHLDIDKHAKLVSFLPREICVYVCKTTFCSLFLFLLYYFNHCYCFFAHFGGFFGWNFSDFTKLPLSTCYSLNATT